MKMEKASSAEAEVTEVPGQGTRAGVCMLGCDALRKETSCITGDSLKVVEGTRITNCLFILYP